MKDSRLSIRITEKEKNIIEKIATRFSMSTNDYMKYRLFDNNPHLQDEECFYEAAAGSKHDYLTIGTEYFNHFLIRELTKKLYPEDEDDLYMNAYRRATKKINLLGYKKHSKKNKD